MLAASTFHNYTLLLPIETCYFHREFFFYPSKLKLLLGYNLNNISVLSISPIPMKVATPIGCDVERRAGGASLHGRGLYFHIKETCRWRVFTRAWFIFPRFIFPRFIFPWFIFPWFIFHDLYIHQ